MLKKWFPSHDVSDSTIDGLPEMWNRILRYAPSDAVNQVLEQLDVAGDNALDSIPVATQIAVLVPKRKRDRKRPATWKLAIDFSGQTALLFAMPNAADYVGFPWHYENCFRSIGLPEFLYGGYFLTSQIAIETADTIRDRLQDDGQNVPTNLRPFHGDGCGGYSVWVAEDCDQAWYFDHETCELDLESEGGFKRWLHRWFTDNLTDEDDLS